MIEMETEETVGINYWRNITNRELDKILEEAKGLIFLIYNTAEINDIVGFLKRFRPKEDIDILYISLVRSYYHIKMTLEEENLERKRLFILDCVTSMITDVDEKITFTGGKNIEGIFRKPPSDFDKLKGTIEEGLSLLKSIGISADMIVVDSISQFINLSFPTEHQIKNFYRFLDETKKDILGIMHDTMVILYNDRVGRLRYLPKLHADHIIRMDVIREEPEWRG